MLIDDRADSYVHCLLTIIKRFHVERSKCICARDIESGLHIFDRLVVSIDP